LLHALREAADAVAGALVEADTGERLFDGIVPGGRLDAGQASVQPEDLARREPGLVPEELGEVADPSTRRAIAKGRSQHGAGPGARADEAEEELDGRRLAGTVRPEEADELAAADVQVQPVERGGPREALDHPFELDRGRFDGR
jgi:hypothetical protein